MPSFFACSAQFPAPRQLNRFPRPTTRSLIAALTGTLAAASVAPAWGVVPLDDKHTPFAYTRALEGPATSVVSFDFLYGDVTNEEDIPNTEGGFSREGLASGVLIDSGQNNVWMITAGHNLAPVGRYDVDENLTIFPSISIGLSDRYFTSQIVRPIDWYVSSGFGDSAGNLIQGDDYGLVNLGISPDELPALGLSAVPIFERDTPAELVDALEGETVEVVGFGQTGTGDSATSTFLGQRLWGQNRLEPSLAQQTRLTPEGSSNFFVTDFDVDRDDDEYDITPEDFTDFNGAIESVYALKNIGELQVSGFEDSDPRQIPEEDFRVPFESGLAPGDSGGGVFLGNALVGLPISTRAVPVDEDGDGSTDDDGIGFGYSSIASIITLSDEAQGISDLIFFAEQAEIDFLNGERDEFLLTDTELLTLGFNYGAVDLNPIFNFGTGADAQAETNNRRGNAVPVDPDAITDGGGGVDAGLASLETGIEVQKSILLGSYYFGEQLSTVSKAKLIGLLPLTASENLTDQEMIDLVNDDEFLTIESIDAALDDDLIAIYGEPNVDRGIRALQTLDFVPVNTELTSRNAAPPIDLNQIGDFNGDGGFDAGDIDAFIEDMNEGAEWTDLNGDGETNDLDTAAYVEGFLSQLMGDANLDGTVNQTDLNAVLNGWGTSGLGWSDGNFGGQDSIDQFDLNAVLNNWGSSAAPNFEGFAIPEPAGLAALGVVGLAMLRRRDD
ncbi:MAG: hypothetical protein AAF916_00190 [Planctomycetota bacterium]